MFSIVAVPFEDYAALPSPTHRWLLTCLARYADRAGCCWPSMRQLATDARMSVSTVCRRLKEMADLAVFQRRRKGVGRYVYTLAAAYRPRWPGHVSAEKHRVSQAETQEANPTKHEKRFGKSGITEGGLPDQTDRWQARVRSWIKSGGKFWLAEWGEKPGEAGCMVPVPLLEDLRHAR